jgi:hypothetical protein
MSRNQYRGQYDAQQRVQQFRHGTLLADSNELFYEG